MQKTTCDVDDFINLMSEISNNRVKHLEYDAALEDDTIIPFYRLLRDEDEKQTFLDEDKSNKEFQKICPLDETDDIILIVDDKIYVNKVDIAMLDGPDFADKILDATKIVYPHSTMSITFDQP